MEQLFKQRKEKLSFFKSLRKKRKPYTSIDIEEGFSKQCPECQTNILISDLEANLMICPQCQYHFRMKAYERLSLLIDDHSFSPFDERLQSVNPLDFPGYTTKLSKLKEQTGLNDAVITGVGKIKEERYVLAVMDSYFLMGSMGSVVGEKVTRAIEYATKMRLPLLIINCSGGARMQEGIHSLMQMSKTVSALARHDEAGLLYVSLLTDPTTGGVSASYALLGDVVIAEPNALVGFAGPRVIEQTINQTLPEGFQRSQYLLEHGMIDDIVERRDLRDYLGNLPRYYRGGKR